LVHNAATSAGHSGDPRQRVEISMQASKGRRSRRRPQRRPGMAMLSCKGVIAVQDTAGVVYFRSRLAARPIQG
jgi:hypothetical protein